MSQKITKELALELDALDVMVTSLVEILEEKGILTQEEWETKIQGKIEKTKNLKKFRKLE